MEIKALGDDVDADGTFTGYGSVAGNVDSYGDVVAKGAFRETLREAKRSGNWPAMLSQHGSFFGGSDNMPIGVWTEMNEDDKGLVLTGKLAPTPRGEEAYQLLKMTPRPALNGLSIGFEAKEFTLGTKPDDPRRTLKKIELMEVSLVTFPANPLARVEHVKLHGMDPRDLESLLRDAGLSRGDTAKAVAALRSLPQRDAGDPDDPRDAVVTGMVRFMTNLAAQIHH
jgi:HK97 family phage prohead protease